jgi:hypothetical protein
MLKMCDPILKVERRRDEFLCCDLRNEFVAHALSNDCFWVHKCLSDGRGHTDKGCRPGLNICG